MSRERIGSIWLGPSDNSTYLLVSRVGEHARLLDMSCRLFVGGKLLTGELEKILVFQTDIFSEDG